MEKVLEKTVKCYVVACIDDGYCWYLKVERKTPPGQLVAQKEFTMTTDIEKADKYGSRNIARIILDDYKVMCKDNVDLVIVPLEIDYNLIKEIEEC